MLSLPAAAQDGLKLTDADRSVFFFGGGFHSAWFWNTFNPFNLSYEGNYVLGAGYQQTVLDFDWVNIDVEMGVAARIAADGDHSMEAWSGLATRFVGWELFDAVQIRPSLTLGFSYVTDTIGKEKLRTLWATAPADFLVYMAPEISISTLDNPDTEYFFRIQHRSGGLGFIMSFDGSNAATAGVRLKF